MSNTRIVAALLTLASSSIALPSLARAGEVFIPGETCKTKKEGDNVVVTCPVPHGGGLNLATVTEAAADLFAQTKCEDCTLPAIEVGAWVCTKSVATPWSSCAPAGQAEFTTQQARSLALPVQGFHAAAGGYSTVSIAWSRKAVQRSWKIQVLGLRLKTP